MAAPDLEVIKEIPGYKVILKAVLKAQIQQLVEQLAVHTDEESVILTASVSDGTLCHLGSESGKVFLEDHDDIKSQFLGFCLKRHHRKKQKEKEEAAQRSVPTTPTRLGPSGFGPRPGANRMGTPPRHQFSPTRFQGSPRFSSGQSPHPISLSRVSPQGAGGHIRSSPYPANRPIRRPNFDQGAGGPRLAKPMKLPVASGNGKVHKMNLGSSDVIKIEAVDDDDDTDGDKTAPGDSSSGIKISSVSGAVGPGAADSSPSSPSHTPSTPQLSDSAAKDDASEAKSDSSSSTIPHDPSEMKLPEGLSLDSDLSNLISETDTGNVSSMDSNIPPRTPQSGDSNSEPPTPGTSNTDSNVNVKIEAITESEMDLEITGVEPGVSGEWTPNVHNRMGFGAVGGQGAMPDDQSEEGYSSPSLMYEPGQSNILPSNIADHGDGERRYHCHYCGRAFDFQCHLSVHLRIHTGHKPFTCSICGRAFAQKSNLNVHCRSQHSNNINVRDSLDNIYTNT